MCHASVSQREDRWVTTPVQVNVDEIPDEPFTSRGQTMPGRALCCPTGR
jgi:hypothetical protein